MTSSMTSHCADAAADDDDDSTDVQLPDFSVRHFTLAAAALLTYLPTEMTFFLTFSFRPFLTFKVL